MWCYYNYFLINIFHNYKHNETISNKTYNFLIYFIDKSLCKSNNKQPFKYLSNVYKYAPFLPLKHEFLSFPIFIFPIIGFLIFCRIWSNLLSDNGFGLHLFLSRSDYGLITYPSQTFLLAKMSLINKFFYRFCIVTC